MVMGFCCSVHIFSSSFPITRDLIIFGGWLCSDGMKCTEVSLHVAVEFFDLHFFNFFLQLANRPATDYKSSKTYTIKDILI